MKFYSIQYIRGLAALLVVLYHFAVYLERIHGQPWLHNLVKGRPGLYGVVAFFVLSGYLMAEIAPRTSPATFVVHRIARIYPAYWASVILAACFYGILAVALRPDASYIPAIQQMLFGQGWLSWDILRLTLVPMVFPDFPLGIEWTLLYETTFYVVVGLVSLMGMARHLPFLAAAWLAILVVVRLNYPELEARYTHPDLQVVLLFGINAGFAFGMLGSRVVAHVRPWIAFPLGITLLVLTDQVPSHWSMIGTCAGIAAVVLGAIALERSGRMPECALLRRLGDWSYAMYLLHVPVILGVLKLVPSTRLAVLLPIALVCVVLTSAVLGQADLALYARLKRILDTRPESMRRALAAGFVLIFFSAALLSVWAF